MINKAYTIANGSVAASVSALLSSAYGEGLSLMTAGVLASFTIQARDGGGRPTDSSLSAFSVVDVEYGGDATKNICTPNAFEGKSVKKSIRFVSVFFII